MFVNYEDLFTIVFHVGKSDQFCRPTDPLKYWDVTRTKKFVCLNEYDAK